MNPPYFIAMRDHGAHDWDTLPLAQTPAEIHNVITESFDGYDGMQADLKTCQIWHFTADCPPRDVTEDVLIAIGRFLSDKMDAAEYPDAFLKWADLDIRGAVADRRAAQWQADHHKAMVEDAA
jgi:hypothetical protein